MKKNNDKYASIFTINGYHNYGNRLQLFALTKILNRMGFNTKVYWPKFLNRTRNFLFRNMPILGLKYKKERKLRSFTKHYLPKSSKCWGIKYSVVGSDQVWNPKWLPNSPYLLDAPNRGVKISYAASMGVDTLTREQKQLFKQQLQNYDAISVREKAAKELLQPLTNKPIEVVLDPTLLLDVSDYKKIEKRPVDVSAKEKYILCYILGNKETLDYIERFAAKKGFRMILFSDKSGSDYGIEEFLYLVHHAELICTDSFHACVFSFLFDRPFVVFRRTGGASYMYSRLQNLLDTFKLNNHEFNGKELSENVLKTNYTLGKKILEKERRESLRFLENALGVRNES